MNGPVLSPTFYIFLTLLCSASDGALSRRSSQPTALEVYLVKKLSSKKIFIYFISLYFTFRGVFQSLIEKHFPAPDRRKTMDWLGLGSSLFGDSPSSSPKSSTGKRKNSKSSHPFSHNLNDGIVLFLRYIISILP